MLRLQIKQVIKVWFLPSNWNSKIKDREHLCPSVTSKQVCNNCWCNGRITCLTDANYTSQHKKPPEMLKKCKVKKKMKRSTVWMYCERITLLMSKRYIVIARNKQWFLNSVAWTKIPWSLLFNSINSGHRLNTVVGDDNLGKY